VCGADGKQLHLLSVFRPDTGTVAAQRAMRDKGCEVTHFAAVLDTLDSIAGLIVTADALHCQRKHALSCTSETPSNTSRCWAASPPSLPPSTH
jgi:hypothetical protein